MTLCYAVHSTQCATHSTQYIVSRIHKAFLQCTAQCTMCSLRHVHTCMHIAHTLSYMHTDTHTPEFVRAHPLVSIYYHVCLFCPPVCCPAASCPSVSFLSSASVVYTAAPLPFSCLLRSRCQTSSMLYIGMCYVLCVVNYTPHCLVYYIHCCLVNYTKLDKLL